MWHSVWEGGTHWREPQPAGGWQDVNGEEDGGYVGGNFADVIINNGNQMFAAWYDYNYSEITVLQCEIEGAPAEIPQPRPTSIPSPVVTPTPTSTLSPVSTVRPTPTGFPTAVPVSAADDPNPGLPVLVGVLPALAAIAIMVFVQHFRNRSGP